ncbi:MAG: hypothetical protein CMA59_02525 [Euryarchaeota archaeon]|nr:hypothetical protein [Euryarchaeota archaeon]
MEIFAGLTMVGIGAYLFWEPSYWRKPEPKKKGGRVKKGISGDVASSMKASLRPAIIPRKGLRIYRAFGIVGALIGEIVASGAEFPQVFRMACIFLGFMIGYILPRVAENYVVVLGPPLAVILGHEYLIYERGIDLQEVFSVVPVISEISHPVLYQILLVSTTFLTLAFRMYLRQVLPIFMSGLLSGGLIGNGVMILYSGSFPETDAEIDLRISAILALCSITLQMYVKYYGRDRSIKKERAEARDRRLNKRTGDILVLRCPSCSQEAPHKIVNRKEVQKGFEVLVNCRGLNQFDEVCNFHHTVIELARQ